jgi:hypothetical protein
VRGTAVLGRLLNEGAPSVTRRAVTHRRDFNNAEVVNQYLVQYLRTLADVAVREQT